MSLNYSVDDPFLEKVVISLTPSLLSSSEDLRKKLDKCLIIKFHDTQINLNLISIRKWGKLQLLVTLNNTSSTFIQEIHI